MSLTVNGSSASTIAQIPEGTYLAVCNLLVDLGQQYNEAFKNSARKVMIGWEIPDETIELDDGIHSRTITKRYTASLNEKSNLRQDLAAWRGRDFTPAELDAFDLRNIVGTSCFINIIHREGSNGKTYANISSIMALPKGTPKGRLSENAIVFDLDTASIEDVDSLPKWIADIVKQSSTYAEKAVALPDVTDMPDDMDDGQLPF